MATAENGNASFQDAVARARQIAAKLAAGGGDDGQSLKRPFDGSNDSQPDAKKMATSNDLINAQLQNLAGQTQPPSAGPVPAIGTPPDPSTIFGLPFGPSSSEIITVPDRMVGLLIGKGGEQIASIQSETQCRIQFAPDSGGLPVRQCTLTGSVSAIQKAKETITRLVAKIQGGPLDNEGDGVLEIRVPGGKVGLIIGKGGETIKSLQERAGVKIVVIQDTNTPTQIDKPVRITGDRMSCQRAKDMIMDLLAEKDLMSEHAVQGTTSYGGYGGGPGGNASGGGAETLEVPVPRNLIGVIIGKGGDMIKKIQDQSGSRIQFKPEDDEMGGPTRICLISGSPQGNQTARGMIVELIDAGQQRQGGGGDMGRGGPRGRGRGMDPYGGDGGWGAPGGGNPHYDGTQTYIIPADKCGLVIGKGGETIRQINQQSGAHCELSRDPPPSAHERLFLIRGNPDQVQTAIRLINEKTGQPQLPDPTYRGPPGPMGMPMGGPMGGNPYGPPNPQGMQMQQQMQPGPQHMGGPQPGPGMMPQQPGYGAPQPWGAPYQPMYGQPGPAQPGPGPADPSKQAADPNAAAWAAYYASLYGQAAAPQQQPQPQQPAMAAYGAPAASTAAAQPQPTINPQTGQPDYSAAWAEYYRQQGMHQHAQAILQAAAQQGGGAPAPHPQ